MVSFVSATAETGAAEGAAASSTGIAIAFASPLALRLTCADQGYNCGPAGDGCGNIIMCGDCPAGQICGGGGPNTATLAS